MGESNYKYIVRMSLLIILTSIAFFAFSCSITKDSNSDIVSKSNSGIEQFISIDGAFYYIARNYYPKITELAREFEEFSEHDVVTTNDYGIFHIIYSNLEIPIRGNGGGGNGPVYVFRENDKKYDLVFQADGDEFYSRVEIIEDNRNLELYAYSHVGFSSSPTGNTRSVYKWNGKVFKH